MLYSPRQVEKISAVRWVDVFRKHFQKWSMLTIKAAVAAVLTLIIALPASAADQAPCPGFDAGETSSEELEQFYAKRVVDIVVAAQKRDDPALQTLVGPQANFTIWSGDVGVSSRQRGVAAALDWIERLKPNHFQTEQKQSGPWVITEMDCKIQISFLFRSEGEIIRSGSNAVRMDFRFVDGILDEAEGSLVFVLEGPLG